MFMRISAMRQNLILSREQTRTPTLAPNQPEAASSPKKQIGGGEKKERWREREREREGGGRVVWLLKLLISDASQPPPVQRCWPSRTASPTPGKHPQPSHPAHFLLYLASPLPRLSGLCLLETMTASCVRWCGCLLRYFDTKWLKIFVLFLWGKPKKGCIFPRS